ncbi:helix-turn-helix domain-containing protein [Variovorax sp. HJSM1_2]|uniref:helix-turn-helix domain-containing protein n=1 Tax=Variovorax sp. HJSM1_2 TaxID=3366263 RepID=UPI003BD391FF
MDSLISASARALAAGDALGALKRVALRDDPPALALRGIAMAQLGEHSRARELLRRAARGFGAHEAVARARCVVAEAEVAFAMRDLGGLPLSPRALLAAAATLEAHADQANALLARLVAARWWLLLGRLDQASRTLAGVDSTRLPAAFAAVGATAELTIAELALRGLQLASARAALARAEVAAQTARIPALLAEVAEASALLQRPAARRLSAQGEQSLSLDDVAALRAADVLVVDACQRELSAGAARLALARRPVLWNLARALAQAWPGDVHRDALIAKAFRTRRPDETHRARLRVEMGRLRALLRGLAQIEATPRGFVLRPLAERQLVLLAPPVEGDDAALVALLSDGAAWPTSALALALGASQRTVQRALIDLEAEGRVRSLGLARARRWLAPPLVEFTTILLLPAALPFP